MKVIIKLISAILVINLVACKDNIEFTLSGELYNKKEKNIYAIFDDPIAKADTIKVTDGKFEYSFIPDTITLIRLVNDSGIAVPVFADKGWNVKFKGSFSNPDVTGNGPNKDLQDFRNKISEITDTASLHNVVKSFIMENRQSYASAYILNEFMIQKPNPDMKELEAIITQLDGHIKDSHIVDIIQKNMPEKRSTSPEYINYFSCKDRQGKYISWSSRNTSYTLINIWASWDEKSKADRDSLYQNIKQLPKDRFRVLNISLDFDRKEWEEYCKKENEQWIETCDFKGWKNQIVEQQQISMIPYNILVTNNRKIMAESIYGDVLIHKVKSLIEEDKNKEKNKK